MRQQADTRRGHHFRRRFVANIVGEGARGGPIEPFVLLVLLNRGTAGRGLWLPDLVQADRLGSASSPATGRSDTTTSDRRKKPFQLARGILRPPRVVTAESNNRHHRGDPLWLRHRLRRRYRTADARHSFIVLPRSRRSMIERGAVDDSRLRRSHAARARPITYDRRG